VGLVAIKINFSMALVLGLGVTAAWRTSSTDANVLSANQQGTPQGPAATPAPKPSEEQQSLRLREEIKVIENLLSHAPAGGFSDRGAALYLLADHYVRLGDRTKALAHLQECAALEEGFDPGDDPTFASLKNDQAFRLLAEQVRRRYPPVHRAHVAFTLTQKNLYPEGLAVDTAKRLFYMSNMHLKKVVRITETGEVADFVGPDLYDLVLVLGVHVDPADHSVWCATFPGKKNRPEIVHFDEHGKLLERYTPPGTGPHALNDLVLRDTREIYVTDTHGNRAYRFDRASHRFTELKLSRPLFLPNGITISGDGNVLYIADLLGVVRLDLNTNQSVDVAPAPHDTLAGIDGLYWHNGNFVGVQYGTGANRVMRWRLSPDGRRVASSEVLERGTELVKNPTTGAILDEQFYFIADTGIDNLDSDGKIVDITKLDEPLHIAVVPLN
jgi:sugar lactone lactonase YvrE